MGQPATHIGPAVHRDAYPVMRVATEHFLRGIDVLSEVHPDLVSGLIFLTLWHDHMQGRSRSPIGVRELARRLGVPYETVRRHVRALVRHGHCMEEKGGLTIPAALMEGQQAAAMLRRSYVSAVRMLRDLTRIGVVCFSVGSYRQPRSGRLTKEQTAIGKAGVRMLLTGLRTLNEFFGGDFVKGLVFTAIWTANVKHVTNTPAAGERRVLDDSQRLPVSILAVSSALRLPYETVRRQADVLLKEGQCMRVARKGLVVSAATHSQRSNVGTVMVCYRDVMAALAELKKAGVKI